MATRARFPLDDRCSQPGWQAPTPSRGFTLVELIMVLVLLGVLAVYAVPRVLNTGDFFARGFHDQSLAYLRYAQKTAIAQRRTVCVVFTGNSITLSIANAAAINNCANPLRGPTGDVALAARAGIAYVGGAPTSFNFDALGQPVDVGGALAPTRSLQVGNTDRTITIETATGFVHE